jgi:lipid A 3-O-deacylase
MKFSSRVSFIAILSAFCMANNFSYAADGVSAAFATGNSTQMARIGMQWKWDGRWWQYSDSHISGYWDGTVAYWRADRYRNLDQNQNIADIGLTPVFRWQADSLKGWYGEAGIGVHLLSELYDNAGRRLSTAFEFGDHVGIGYVFGNGADVGMLFQHFSNGSIKQPNNGVNFAMVRFSFPL